MANTRSVTPANSAALLKKSFGMFEFISSAQKNSFAMEEPKQEPLHANQRAECGEQRLRGFREKQNETVIDAVRDLVEVHDHRRKINKDRVHADDDEEKCPAAKLPD